MAAEIIKFPPPITSSEEARLWAAYLVAIGEFHDSLPTLDIQKMRACVIAYDAFMAEFGKTKT